ncbi:phosphorylase [Methylobacterium sp. E-045]|uniref:phosphorylase n=1 Tax=Methylobacterium sp. E-045 TaxID=2836575 RepID=UPI001FBB207F|nr:phosphorylase [Methylobacterium sp. E-045]MCJ2129183.1 phosphorylase [Methylobacterium sp. E-045]
MLPILAVTGLSKEARLAAGPGIEAVGAGGSPQRLRALLDLRREPGCRAVISFGIAGGLDPSLVPGDVVIATGIVGETGRRETDAVLRDALHSALSRADLTTLSADLAGVDAAIMSVEAKAGLHARTGAAAVDMESHVAADFADRHKLPFAAIRVVCDPADRALPAFVATALKPNGDPDLLAVLTALARRPAHLPALIRLARDSGRAFAALSRCRATLGSGLGLPNP